MRDEIMSWMSSLRKCGAATDWAVVIVEPADTKKTNKLLPRTSVLDKLKTDVGGKQPERCMSLKGEQSAPGAAIPRPSALSARGSGYPEGRFVISGCKKVPLRNHDDDFQA